MALIKSYKGLTPKWGRDCYFSENATIVGEVTMGDECSIWFGAVVRGDVAPVTIGNCSNVQDGSCVHVTHETGPTHIGNYVTIGHNVTVHACTIHDHALIGMGATLLDGCEVGEGAIVAAGALVLQNTKIGFEHEVLYVFVPQVQLFNSDGEEETVDVYTKFNIIDLSSGSAQVVLPPRESRFYLFGN